MKQKSVANSLIAKDLKVHHLQSCASTQDVALKKALSESSHTHLVTTELQTHGRGRSGKEWAMTKYSCLTVSLAIPITKFPHKTLIQLVPLIAACAVMSALRKISPEFKRLQYKWPNDLGVYESEFRKAAGILVELKNGVVVTGWGINLRDPCPFPNALTLSEVSRCSINKEELAVEISGAFLSGLSDATNSPESFTDYLLEFTANELMGSMCGRQVRASWGEGIVVGLGAYGSVLVLNKDTGITEIRSGELSV